MASRNVVHFWAVLPERLCGDLDGVALYQYNTALYAVTDSGAYRTSHGYDVIGFVKVRIKDVQKAMTEIQTHWAAGSKIEIEQIAYDVRWDYCSMKFKVDSTDFKTLRRDYDNKWRFTR